MNVGVPERLEELSYDGYILRAMRVVNAIPDVCRAKAVLLTVHDVPLCLPHDAFRSDVTFNEGHKICTPVKK